MEERKVPATFFDQQEEADLLLSLDSNTIDSFIEFLEETANIPERISKHE